MKFINQLNSISWKHQTPSQRNIAFETTWRENLIILSVANLCQQNTFCLAKQVGTVVEYVNNKWMNESSQNKKIIMDPRQLVMGYMSISKIQIQVILKGPHTLSFHDDVIKWKHFPRNWPFVRGIHRSPVNSPHKGQWRGALMFSLICVWINDWVNNREAGDLRRYRALYGVIVMYHYDDAITWKHFSHSWPFVRESAGDRWISLTNGPVMQSSDFAFDVRLNKLLNKKSSCQWIEIPRRQIKAHSCLNIC